MPALAPASIDMSDTVNALFHAETAYGLSRVFNHIPSSAVCPNPPNDGQYNVLCFDTIRSSPVHLNKKGFGPFLKEALRREDMFHFTGSYSKSQYTKSTMGRGVAVSTNQGQSRQSKNPPEFGANARTSLARGYSSHTR